MIIFVMWSISSPTPKQTNCVSFCCFLHHRSVFCNYLHGGMIYLAATLHNFRDAVNEMSLHFLAKMKIMVVKDIERDDIEFYSRILGCRPVASVDHFVPEALGSADLVEEIHTSSDSKIIQVRLMCLQSWDFFEMKVWNFLTHFWPHHWQRYRNYMISDFWATWCLS